MFCDQVNRGLKAKEITLMHTSDEQEIKYVDLEVVGVTLKSGGTVATHTIKFEKQAGGFSEVTGNLVKEIKGDLEPNVVILNTEGNYKSFNPSRVIEISTKVMGGAPNE